LEFARRYLPEKSWGFATAFVVKCEVKGRSAVQRFNYDPNSAA
jgi:hypothetical protein